MFTLSPATLGTSEQYRLLSGAVVPRPIALVVTKGPTGWNAAPFSFFTMLGVQPPTLIFSAGPRDGAEKDTIRNLRALPECVIHIVTEEISEKMNACAASLSPDDSEVEAQGFELAPSVVVTPPRLVEFPVQLECKVVEFLEIGSRPHIGVIAEVVQFHAHDGIVDADLRYNVDQLKPIGRISGDGLYVRLTDTFRLQQPE